MPLVYSTCFCSLLFPIICLNKSRNLGFINPQTIENAKFYNESIDPKPFLVILIKSGIFFGSWP